MNISQADRERLLAKAITAARALRDDTTPAEPAGARAPETKLLYRAAVDAVTEAVTAGQHIHTLISSAISCPGTFIVRLIDDWDARAKALVYERHAAERYAEAVRAEIRSMALHEVRYAQADPTRERVPVWQREAVKAPVAEKYGITRVTLDKWLAQAEAEAAANQADDDQCDPTT